MIPDECASIRSIARCVLPVLVGPSTAVTPAPGTRSLANPVVGEKAIFFGCFLYAVEGARSLRTVSDCDAPVDIWRRFLRLRTSPERNAAESLTLPSNR